MESQRPARRFNAIDVPGGAVVIARVTPHARIVRVRDMSSGNTPSDNLCRLSWESASHQQDQDGATMSPSPRKTHTLSRYFQSFLILYRESLCLLIPPT